MHGRSVVFFRVLLVPRKNFTHVLKKGMLVLGYGGPKPARRNYRALPLLNI